MTRTRPPPTLLPEAEWRQRQAAHEHRVDAWTGAHLDRARRGIAHPVEDFLFTYYAHRPAQLRRWSPGPDVALAGGDAARTLPWAAWEPAGDGVTLTRAVPAKRLDAARRARTLLERTAGRPPALGCFGLHEWAMVYREPPARRQHPDWPLRLGDAGTAAVVEELPLRCTHVDAFRFFAAPTRPRNAVQPTRATQVDLEQPGCLHATMDLYKWAFTLSPLVAAELVADCFALAREVRVLDMRASPYDLSALGYAPVPIETPAGRAEYVAAQRAYAVRGAGLRERVRRAATDLLDWAGAEE